MQSIYRYENKIKAINVTHIAYIDKDNKLINSDLNAILYIYII